MGAAAGHRVFTFGRTCDRSCGPRRVSTATAQLETCLGQVATIVGDDTDQFLTGSDGNDVIVGLGGNDVIHGGLGDDIICGGDAND